MIKSEFCFFLKQALVNFDLSNLKKYNIKHWRDSQISFHIKFKKLKLIKQFGLQELGHTVYMDRYINGYMVYKWYGI